MKGNHRPAPDWHEKARKLRASEPKRWTYKLLGERFGRSKIAAYWACNPEKAREQWEACR